MHKPKVAHSESDSKVINPFREDVGVVQGSGLGPVKRNIYLASIVDATRNCSVGFADDLNLMTTPQTRLDSVMPSTTSCVAARVTMQPAKEAMTTF